MPSLKRFNKELPIEIKGIRTDEKGRINANVDISVEYADRSNEVVLIKGIDDKSYKKNNVILWSHDPQIPAIGNMINLTKNGKTYSGTMVFHGLTETSKDVAKLVEAKVIKSVSIGFIPLKMESAEMTDQVRAEYKVPADKNNLWMFTKSEIVEVSVVNIPANKYATVKNILDGDSLVVKHVNSQMEITGLGTSRNENKLNNIDDIKLQSFEENMMGNIAESLQELSEDIINKTVAKDDIESALNQIMLESKAGRVLSSATQTKLKSALTAMDTAIKALNSLIEAASNESEAEPEKAIENVATKEQITDEKLQKLVDQFTKI